MTGDPSHSESMSEALVELHETSLRQCAQRIGEENVWSFSSPVVLVKECGEAVVIPVSAIGNHLTVCEHVDHPLIQEWLNMTLNEGPAKALESMLSDTNLEKAGEFAGLYDAWRKDVQRRGHGTVSAGDLAHFVSKARGCWPDEVPVLAVLKEEGKVEVLTFCVAVSDLLR